ncbi:MAG TPA: hypothetical protein ENN34_04920 [Deltaproteobacteria bacterium]|nr:hypothetical protein [Deltaproteobacteria bacterium]
MPRGDRTGPAGYGPMTGRGAGYCAGFSVPGYMNPYPGRGYGRGFGGGFGGGFGWRHRNWAGGSSFWGRGRGRGFGVWGTYPGYAPYPPGAPYAPGDPYQAGPYTKKDQLDDLTTQAQHLEEELNEIRKHIEMLEAQKEEE